MRWVAFLRGINLGKRRVKMDQLRRAFEDLGFQSVATYIASGNVIFDSAEQDGADLEAKIAAHLSGALGFEVGTYLRTLPQLQRVVESKPFPPSEVSAPEHKVHVIFLDREPDAGAADRLRELETSHDAFTLIGREMYWLTRGRFSDSQVPGKLIDKALGGVDGTARNMNTVRAILEKYG